MAHINIAIDGPAGAGKSTVAKALAREMGITYLDTGAMYRAMALKLLRSGIARDDAKTIEPIVNRTDILVTNRGGVQEVYLDEENVTDLIRTGEVSAAASDAAKLSCVRKKLVELQQGIARGNDVVMDGRDIGTDVLPDALYKFFVTASLDERAKRRYLELTAAGNDVAYEQIRAEVEARDINDSTRDISPLRQAEDAILVDTTELSIDEVVASILEMVKR